MNPTRPFGQDFLPRCTVSDFMGGPGDADGSALAWTDVRIEAFPPSSPAWTLSPACSALHYGQIAFEGLKAHPANDGSLRLFRPEAHHLRLQRTCARLAMPCPPYGHFLAALEGLLADRRANQGGVYFRPVVMATEAFLGVRAAESYRFFVIACPSQAYFTQPLRLRTETVLARACVGGTGDVKTPGNYAASLAASREAKREGFSDVLWLDAAEHAYVEEAGAMNIFFVHRGTLITPALTGSILPGITRDTVLGLARNLGLAVREARIGIDELEGWRGKDAEAFGTGTAAGIAPIASITHAGRLLWQAPTEGDRPSGPGGEITARLRTALNQRYSGEAHP